MGGLSFPGGGEEEERGGGEVLVRVWGVCVEVGLLAADWGKSGLRSSPPTRPATGECRESLRAQTGEAKWEGEERGGGEENLRQRRGDLSLTRSPPPPLWFRLF